MLSDQLRQGIFHIQTHRGIGKRQAVVAVDGGADPARPHKRFFRS